MQGHWFGLCAAIAAVGCTFEGESALPAGPDAGMEDDAAPLGEVCWESFVVASDSDVTRAATCGAIVGNLWIGGDAVEVSLPLLTSIEGDFTVEGAHVEAVLAPRLASVAGSVIVRDSPRMRWLDLARVGRVAHNLLIVDTTFVQTIDLRSLIAVGSVLQIERVAFAHELRLDSLRRVGVLLRVVDNPLLPACRAEAICDRLVVGGFDPARCVIAANDEDAECL